MNDCPDRSEVDEARDLYYAGKLTAHEYLERVLAARAWDQTWQALVYRVEQSFVRLLR